MVVDFTTSMSGSKNFANPKQLHWWERIKEAYNYNMNNPGEARIPRVIHQIWLGKSMPADIERYVDSIKKTNPTFEHRLWTDKDVEAFDFANKHLFFQTPNVGQRSDILRYAILEKMGGVYLDADFQGYNSFESLLHLNLFAGVSYDAEPVLFNGLIGSVPNHPIIQAINKELEPKHGDGMAVIGSTGPYFFTKKFYKHFNESDKIVVLPLTYFYPYPNFAQDKIYGDDLAKYIKPETICAHLWHSSWN
jgi:mannosyltransferase OCH1-like enzyme